MSLDHVDEPLYLLIHGNSEKPGDEFLEESKVKCSNSAITAEFLITAVIFI